MPTPAEIVARRQAMLARLQPVKLEARQAAAKLHAKRQDRQHEAAQGAEVRELVGQHPLDLFPTPPELAARMVQLARLDFGMIVCEPSAGTGNIAEAIRASGTTPICIEMNYNAAQYLTRQGYAVDCADFLESEQTADRFVMNPPFSHGADVKHVEHARQLLKPGGLIVAIMSGGPRTRAYAEQYADTIEDLPAGTFKQSGTNVSAILVTIPSPAGGIVTGKEIQ